MHVFAFKSFRHQYWLKKTVTLELWQACVLGVVQKVSTQETSRMVVLNIQRTIKFPSIEETLSQTGSKVNKGWDKQAHHSQDHQHPACSANAGKSQKWGTRRSLAR